MTEPFSPNQVKALCRRIIKEGTVQFSPHVEDEMLADGLSQVDCTNVLRGGVVDPGEPHGVRWRYRVQTQMIGVIIAFRSETFLTVVTAWKKR